jgi:hypothetical protein
LRPHRRPQNGGAEACINAIEHGNKSDASSRVIVVLTVERAPEVNVADGHEPFPPVIPEPG